mmetsp:Transcript_21672/g.60243  ORF Transcript_21672/g.60243 Transcript_21672/m.60243 type:complete len:283 (+) Transcript_21672:350-1198(+)
MSGLETSSMVWFLSRRRLPSLSWLAPAAVQSNNRTVSWAPPLWLMARRSRSNDWSSPLRWEKIAMTTAVLRQQMFSWLMFLRLTTRSRSRSRRVRLHDKNHDNRSIESGSLAGSWSSGQKAQPNQPLPSVCKLLLLLLLLLLLVVGLGFALLTTKSGEGRMGPFSVAKNQSDGRVRSDSFSRSVEISSSRFRLLWYDAPAPTSSRQVSSHVCVRNPHVRPWWWCNVVFHSSATLREGSRQFRCCSDTNRSVLRINDRIKTLLSTRLVDATSMSRRNFSSVSR